MYDNKACGQQYRNKYSRRKMPSTSYKRLGEAMKRITAVFVDDELFHSLLFVEKETDSKGIIIDNATAMKEVLCTTFRPSPSS